MVVAELRRIGVWSAGHHLVNLAQAGPAALLPVLVTARLGTDSTAHFYVAWMTASVLFMVSPAVASALFAERANAHAARLRNAAAVTAAVLAVPASILFVLGGPILGLFGDGYAAQGELLLKVLVLAAVPDAITNLAVAHWRSAGDLRRCLRLNVVRAAGCLGLAWFWLPAGPASAGIAWLAGQTAAAVLVGAYSLRRRP